jgi:hypothetical protein
MLVSELHEDLLVVTQMHMRDLLALVVRHSSVRLQAPFNVPFNQ